MRANSARTVIALGVALALALAPPAGEARTGASGLRGVVTISGCPGPVRPGQNCTKRFAGASIRVVRIGGVRLTRTFKSRAEGRFRVSLPPGRYRLVPQTSGIARAAPTTVRVQAHRYRWVHIDYDNGLR